MLSMVEYLKAWFRVYFSGITNPPQGKEKTTEELLKGFDEPEWD